MISRSIEWHKENKDRVNKQAIERRAKYRELEKENKELKAENKELKEKIDKLRTDNMYEE